MTLVLNKIAKGQKWLTACRAPTYAKIVKSLDRGAYFSGILMDQDGQYMRLMSYKPDGTAFIALNTLKPQYNLVKKVG